MDNKLRGQINGDIDAAMDDIITTIEEDRMYPSVREAGSAPTESAVESSFSMAQDLVEAICVQLGVMEEGDLTHIPTFEEIMGELEATLVGKDEWLVNLTGEAEEYQELKEIECFTKESDSKYRWIDTIYQYKDTDDYLCIEEQRSAGTDETTCGWTMNKTTRETKTVSTWS